MKNLFSALQDMGKIQSKMDEMRNKIDALEASGKAGGELVQVTLKGGGDMVNLTIEPKLLESQDVDMLQDLIVAAFNNARENLEIIRNEKTKEIMAGLPLPEGFKLPF